jgi:hypothetical protein
MKALPLLLAMVTLAVTPVSSLAQEPTELRPPIPLTKRLRTRQQRLLLHHLRQLLRLQRQPRKLVKRLRPQVSRTPWRQRSLYRGGALCI